MMILKICLSKGIAGIRVTYFAALNKKNGNQHDLAIKAEVEADFFEKAIQKLMGKNETPTGEVLRQISIFDNDVVAFVHNMNKKLKSFKEFQAHHFDHIVVLLNAISKNPFREEQIKQVRGRTVAS